MGFQGKNKDKQRKAMFAKYNDSGRQYGNSPTLFIKPKNKRLARIIRIDSPSQFRNSIRILKQGGLTNAERQALILAKQRAFNQLEREDLSRKERIQFKTIKNTEIPQTPEKSRALRTRSDPFKSARRRMELKNKKK